MRAISDVCFLPNLMRGRGTSVATVGRSIVWRASPGGSVPSARPDLRRCIGAALARLLMAGQDRAATSDSGPGHYYSHYKTSALCGYPQATASGRLFEIGPQWERRVRHQRPTGITKLRGYVKVPETAQILGVSQNTVRVSAENGNLPAHRNPASRYRLFRRVDLEKFLAAIARPQRPK